MTGFDQRIEVIVGERRIHGLSLTSEAKSKTESKIPLERIVK